MMNNEQKFLVSITAIAAIAIVLVAQLSVNYWKDHNAKIVQLIEQGTDPVAVMCAMQDDYGRNPVCLVLAAKENVNEPW